MKLINIAVAIFVILLMAGCSGQITGKVAEDQEIVIGGIHSFTGNNAQIGLWNQESAELALKDINKKGINGKKMRVIYEDDQYDPKTSGTKQTITQSLHPNSSRVFRLLDQNELTHRLRG